MQLLTPEAVGQQAALILNDNRVIEGTVEAVIQQTTFTGVKIRRDLGDRSVVTAVPASAIQQVAYLADQPSLLESLIEADTGDAEGWALGVLAALTAVHFFIVPLVRHLAEGGL